MSVFHKNDVLGLSRLITIFRLTLTSQISLMQSLVKTETCAENVENFDCSMGCVTTLGGALDALEDVSRQVLGKCRFYHKKFTNVQNQLRTQLNIVAG